jgi:hypothetical protein
MPRYAELANDKDIQRRVERPGDFERHRNPASREGEHEHIGSAGIARQRRHEALARIESIRETQSHRLASVPARLRSERILLWSPNRRRELPHGVCQHVHVETTGSPRAHPDSLRRAHPKSPWPASETLRPYRCGLRSNHRAPAALHLHHEAVPTPERWKTSRSCATSSARRRVRRQREAARLGRRMALTFPLFPPPQKNWSAPLDSSPETNTPGGMSTLSRTSPVSWIDPPQIALRHLPTCRARALRRAT